MRTIIAGSRGLDYLALVEQAIAASGFSISCVICGMADGPDLRGKQLAKRHQVPWEEYPAEWWVNGKFDRSAGHKRNGRMADVAEALILIWDGKSPGSKSMYEWAVSKGLKIFVYRLDEETLEWWKTHWFWEKFDWEFYYKEEELCHTTS